jgi:hypothetical protein
VEDIEGYTKSNVNRCSALYGFILFLGLSIGCAVALHKLLHVFYLPQPG